MADISAPNSWEQYPANLPSHICNPFAYDLPSLNDRLISDSSRLFVENHALKIQIIESGAGGVSEHYLEGRESLENYLAQSQVFEGTRICLISQPSSRGRLTASSDGMRQLLTHFAVFPDFLSILHQFGLRMGNESQSYGSFSRISRSGTTELCYLLKYVEEHGRTHEQNPWSIRHVGVYQNSNHKNNTFIVLSCPQSLEPRLKAILATPGTVLSGSDFRLLLFSTVSRNWPKYVDWLDEAFQELKRSAHSASPASPPTMNTRYAPDITISDAQDIEVHRVRICEARSCLTTNSDILSEIRTTESTTNGQIIENAQFPEEQHVAQYHRLYQNQSQRLRTLLETVDSTSALVHNILDVRGLVALEANSRTTAEISQRTEAGNGLMLYLSQESARDAHTLKVITIVTLVYLPASFIAQLLSTGYISVSRDQQKGNIELHFKGELVVFAVLTVIFLAVTLGIWLWLDNSYKEIERKSSSFFIKDP